MKKLTCALSLLALAGFLSLCSGHAAEPNEVEQLMKKKLVNSQKVLEGLSLNNYDQIATSADELIQISKTAEWMVFKTPQYELYSNQFRRNAEALITAARAKNIDGATLAYVDMTMTCVKCHKHVREVRTGRLDSQPDVRTGLARNSQPGD